MSHVSLLEQLRELHLFCGAGGGVLGGILLGHTTVCAVEIEPYCRRVLLQRQRDGILPKFPCQDISIAAGPAPAGIEGSRSGLWKEMARIIGEIRPKYAFVENSQMLVDRGLALVLGDLAELGYDARWGCVSARDAAGPHLRDRAWILSADTNQVRLQQGVEQSRVLAKKIGIGSQWNGQFARGCDNNLSRWGWTNSSTFARVADGVAHRNDRLKATGNGQVPAVAALAWRVLMG